MTDRGRYNTRSRRNNYRGGSRSRGRGQPSFFTPPINYAAPEEIKKVEEEKAKLEARLQQNEQLAKAAEAKPRNPNKDKIIEEGKEIVSKFFKGFTPTERGNVKVTLDSTFVHRVAEPYYEKVDQVVRDMNSDIGDEAKIEEAQKELAQQLVGAIDIATAVKLYKSSPSEDQDRLFYYNAIHKPSMNLPKKVGIILNQLGKTDLKDDNKVRIVGQDLMAKRHLVRGIYRYCSERKMSGYMKDPNKYSDLNRLSQAKYFDGMIDSSSSSVIYILENIQQRFDDIRSQAHEVQDANGQKAKVSFPPFDFKNATPATLKEYADDGIFKIFEFKKNNDMTTIAALTALSLINLSWLKDPSKTVGDRLGNDKTNTAIDTVPISGLLNWLGYWSINDYFDDRELNELAIMCISEWNGSISPRLKGYIKIENINFSEYGSDSQIVEIDRRNISYNTGSWKEVYRLKHDINLNIMVGKTKSWVKQKISESGAIFGSIIGFNKKVEYTSNFDIQIEGNNKNILREFVKSDML